MMPTTIFALALWGQAALPGSHLDLGRAEARAGVIASGRVVASTPRGAGAAFAVRVVAVEPGAVHKGKAGGADIPWDRLALLALGEEVPPAAGRDYLFFVRGAAILKVAPDTAANRATLREIARRPPLPGDRIAIPDAAERAAVVATGRVVAHWSSFGSGGLCTGSFDFEVAWAIKGTARVGEQRRLAFGFVGADQIPEVGREYVVFLDRADGPFANVIKMAPPTAENLDAARPAVLAGE